MAKRKSFGASERPDSVVETPFFRMERQGRFLKITNSRAPEEQAKIVTSIVENRHRLLDRAKECRAELKALIHRFSSLDILAHQIAQDIIRDPNKYQEIDSELRPHLIEYLALLELEDPEYEVRAIQSPTPEDVFETRLLLEEIFDAFKWQIMTEHVTEEKQGALTVQQELRYSALMYHVFVRSPAYHHHWVEILEPLFRSVWVAEWLAQLDLRISDVLKCVDWLGGLLLYRLRDRLRQARAEELRVREQMKKVRRGEKPDFELPEIFLRIAKENGKNRAQMLESVLQQWALYAVGTTMSVTPKEVSDYAEVSLAAAEAFLKPIPLVPPVIRAVELPFVICNLPRP